MNRYRRIRRQYRINLNVLSLTSVVLTAVVTVLLGLSVASSVVEVLLKNIALGISAFLTVLHAIDALHEFQSRYISNEIVYKRLQQLSFTMSYYRAGLNGQAIDSKILEEYKKTFSDILGLRWSDIDMTKGVLQVSRTLNYLPRYGFIKNRPKTRRSERNKDAVDKMDGLYGQQS